MATQLTDALRAQFYAQEANDPFLTLVTLSNASFTARLVNNSSDITSRGNVFTAYPMKIRLPIDDGETARDIAIDFDNVSLDLISNIRTVTDPIDVTIEMILASIPDVVQMDVTGLSIGNITYNSTKISATLLMDNFLSVAMTAESYAPINFPGLF